MTRPNDEQVGGTHYRDMDIQPWDAMRAWMSPEQFRGYLRGCTLKYLARCDVKGGIEDLRKARHYLDKLIETYPPALMVSDCTIDTSLTKEDVGAFLGIKPAVSESAAGGAISPVRFLTDAAAVVMRGSGADWYACGFGRHGEQKPFRTITNSLDPNVGVEHWPGPDWSQAPSSAMWWVVNEHGLEVWLTSKPWMQNSGWNYGAGIFWVGKDAGGYPGHWRDSLRERPKAAPLNPPRPSVPATGHDAWTYLGVYQEECGTKAHAWKRLSDARFFGVWQDSGNTFMFSCLEGPAHDPSWKPCSI